jgi:hypothetical protein
MKSIDCGFPLATRRVLVRSGAASPAPAFGDFDPSGRPFDSRHSANDIDLASTCTEAFLCPRSRLSRAFGVDLLRPFCCRRKDGDLVVEDFEKATREGNVDFVAALSDGQGACLQRGHESRMPGQYSELAFSAGKSDRLDAGLRVDDPLRGDDLQV